MKLSLSVLLVMKDALYGSLQIHANRIGLFMYTHEAREAALKVVHEMLNEITLDIEVAPEKSTEE